MIDTLKPYDFHGAELQTPSEGATEVRATCFFCEHESQKFYINLETGQYNCKHCGESGNTHTFLSAVLDWALEHTNTAEYRTLQQHRDGIPYQMFREAGFALDPRYPSPRWLIPVYNSQEAVVNLRVYEPGRHVMSTAGLPLYLWREELLRPNGSIFICEGEWDALALEALRRRANRRNENILAVPGAHVFKDDWVRKFVGRDVYLCYDNDGPGAEGAERTAYKLAGHVRSLHILKWPATVADGYDIRDYVTENGNRDGRRVWSNLMALMETSTAVGVSQEPEDEEPLKRTAFSTVARDFRKHYYVTDSMSDALAIMFAVVASVQIPGDPLWLFMVGPPGSGKTLFLRSFERSPQCVFKSSLTPRSLISGFAAGEGDPSLIPQLTGKVLVLKDYTEIMTMHKDQQDEMYGVLRGAYDGHAEKSFGNGITRTYHDCYFSMLAGVTDAIHGDDRASLGERFLKYQFIEPTGYDPTEHIQAAINGMGNQRESERYLRRVTTGFSSRKLEPSKLVKPTKAHVSRVIAIAQVIAYLRATVPRTSGDDMLYRPFPEVGTRLAKQLIKLGQALAFVYNSRTFNHKCWEIITRVAKDTAAGWNMDLFDVMFAAYPKSLTQSELEDKAQMSGTTCRRRLDNMMAVGAVDRKRISARQPGRGQPAYGYRLSEDIAGRAKKGFAPLRKRK